MLDKPLHDGWYMLFEISRDGKVQHCRSAGTVILKIMGHTTWDQDERAFGSIAPALAHANAHGPFNPLQGAIPRSLLRTQAVFFPFDTP
jgi:hypothetical protein